MTETVALKEIDTAMTKSKKKRLKRLKAKQHRGEDDELQNKFLPADSSALNPIDKMRKDFVKAGYDIDAVDVALERMWNLGLDYSNFDSVLKFLDTATRDDKEKRSEDTNVGASRTAAVSPTQVASFDSDHDMIRRSSFEFPESPKADFSLVDTAPLSFSTAEKSEAAPFADGDRSVCSLSNKEGILQTPKYLNSTVYENDSANKPLGDEKITNFVADDSCEPTLRAVTNKATTVATANGTFPATDSMWKQPLKQKDRKKIIRIKPFDLTAKLEIVANHEKLTDAIIALTEWVVKVASPMEIQKLCTQSSNNNALNIVVRRTMQQQPACSRSSVGQLLDLVGSILRKVSVPSTQIMSTAKALGSLLKEASDAMDATSSHDGNKFHSSMADAVASNVTVTIAKIVNRNIGNLDSKGAMMHRLEQEIQQLEKSALLMEGKSSSNNSPSIVDLMTDRDKTKLMLDKYSSLFALSLENSNSQGRRPTSDEIDIQLTESDVIQSVLGDQYQSIVQSKTRLKKLKASENQARSGISEMEKLRNDINVLSSKKKLIGTRMEQLRKELEELVLKEKQVDGELIGSEAKLKTLEGALSVEARELKEKIDGLSQKVKIDDSIAEFAKKVCEFTKVMESVHSETRTGRADANVDATKQSNLNEFGLFITATSRYFSSELKTISFFRNRVDDAKKELPTLQREIKEFESLGMSTTVSDMKKKEKDMLNNMLDDSELVESLTSEADTAKTDFLNQLESFLSSFDLADITNLSHIEMLRDIDVSLTKLGINKDSKWKKIMTQVENLRANSPQATPPVSAEVKPIKNAWNL